MATVANCSLHKAEPHAGIRWPRCLYTVFSASEKPPTICARQRKWEKAEQSQLGRVERRGESIRAVKGGLGKLLTAPCLLQPDGCNVLLPALQPPRLVQPAQPGNGSEEQNQIKGRTEKGREQTRNDATASLSRIRCAVCLWSPLISKRMQQH